MTIVKHIFNKKIFYYIIAASINKEFVLVVHIEVIVIYDNLIGSF